MKAVLLAAAVLAACGAPGGEKPGVERKVYAHYMGCNPALTRAMPYHFRNAHRYLKDRPQPIDWACGNTIGWQLAPSYDGKYTYEQNAEVEIRQAMRMGFDGFAIDAWAGRDGAKQCFDAFIRTAEKMGVDFQMTICLDAACQGCSAGTNTLEKFIDSAKFLLKYRDSPNLARVDGKPLVFGYYSRFITRDGKTASGEKQDRGKSDREFEEVGEAWRKFREALGTEIYLHGSLDGLAPEARKAGTLRALGEWAGRTFDTVGGFIGGGRGADSWRNDAELVGGVKSVGGKWSPPLVWQYNNKRGDVIVGEGLDILRESWKAILGGNAQVVQFVTWNDYGEETAIAPSFMSSYTVGRVNRYYADWWKRGVKPKVGKDEIHAIFRRTLPSAETYPLFARRRNTPFALEIVTFLTAPGRISVDGYGEYDAPAGLHFMRFDAYPGPVAATLRRGGQKVLRLECPERISDRPWREDHVQYAFGTNFDEEWAKDFPGTNPPRYAEFGDADGDGLPNWFEMLYFGKYPYIETATVADPSADPDGDGKTNLEEFRARTNPLVADVPYPAGFRWSLCDLTNAPALFNPSADARGRRVWYVQHKFGKRGEIPFDGDYEMSWCDAPYSYRITSSFTPPKGIEASWARFDPKTGIMRIRPFGGTVMPVVWKSPVDGIVTAFARVKAGKGHVRIRVLLARGGSPLAETSLKAGEYGEISAASVSVAKGESIMLVPDAKDVWGMGELEIEGFSVVLGSSLP